MFGLDVCARSDVILLSAPHFPGAAFYQDLDCVSCISQYSTIFLSEEGKFFRTALSFSAEKGVDS
jgi:hypothetical protein